MTEIVLGERAELIEVETDVGLAGGHIGCCSLGNRILMVAGKERLALSDSDSSGEDFLRFERRKVCRREPLWFSYWSSTEDDSAGQETDSASSCSSSLLSSLSELAFKRPSDTTARKSIKVKRPPLTPELSSSPSPAEGRQLKSEKCSDKGCQISAALILIDKGKLSKSAIHITALTVQDDTLWSSTPYLCQVSETRALLYLEGQRQLWYCDLTGTNLATQKLEAQMPTISGFCTLPIALPGGELLVQGARPCSKDIWKIVTAGEPQFKTIAQMPGPVRESPSSILIGKRFVLGFGGFSTNITASDKKNFEPLRDDLWVLDLQTSRGSEVRKDGAWHPESKLTALAIRDNVLYLIGTRVSYISLASLSNLIQDDDIKSEFSALLAPAAHKPQAPPSEEVTRLKAALAQEKVQSFELATNIARLADRSHFHEASTTIIISNLRGELSAARREIAALKATIQKLQNRLQRLEPLPGTLVVHLQFKSLPALSFPQRWSIELPRLQRLSGGMKEHQQTFPQRAPLLREYKRIFAPLLSEELPRKVFSLQSSVPVRKCREAVISQVSHTLSPGDDFPSEAGISALARRTPLRIEEKLLDSEAFQKVALVSNQKFVVAPEIKERAPPTYHSIVSLMDSSDPLRIEFSSACAGRLRRVLCATATAVDAGKTRGLSQTIRVLQKLEKLAKTRYGTTPNVTAPWMDSKEKPQSHSKKGVTSEEQKGQNSQKDQKTPKADLRSKK